MENELSVKLQLDETQHVVGYVTVGDLAESVDYTGTIPDGFVEDPQIGRYQLINGQLEVDPNVKPISPTEPQPNDMQKLVMSLIAESAQLKKTNQQMQELIMNQEREIAELKGGTK